MVELFVIVLSECANSVIEEEVAKDEECGVQIR